MSVKASLAPLLLLLLTLTEGSETSKLIKEHIKENSFIRFGTWFYLCFLFPVLVLLMLLLMVLGVYTKFKKDKKSKPVLDFDGLFFIAFYFPLSVGFCNYIRVVTDVGIKKYYRSYAEIMDGIIFALIGLSQITVLIITLFWVQDPKQSCFGRWLAILLKQLRNLHEKTVTSVFTIFCLHKFLLAATLTQETKNQQGLILQYSIAIFLIVCMCLYYVEVIPFRLQKVQNAFVIYEMSNLLLLLVLQNCYFADYIKGSPLRVFNIWQIGISFLFWFALQQIHWRSNRENQYKPGAINPLEHECQANQNPYVKNEKKPADWINNLTETENEMVASSIDKGQPKSIMRTEEQRQLQMREASHRPLPPRRTSQFIQPPALQSSRMPRNHPYFAADQQRSPQRKLTHNDIPPHLQQPNTRLPPDPSRRPNFPPFVDKTRMMNNKGSVHPADYPPEYSDSQYMATQESTIQLQPVPQVQSQPPPAPQGPPGAQGHPQAHGGGGGPQPNQKYARNRPLGVPKTAQENAPQQPRDMQTDIHQSVLDWRSQYHRSQIAPHSQKQQVKRVRF